MSKSDPYGALFFLGLAVYICQQSMGIGVGSLRRPGPGLLSFGAGAGIGLLALAFLIGTFWKRKAGRKSQYDLRANDVQNQTAISPRSSPPSAVAQLLRTGARGILAFSREASGEVEGRGHTATVVVISVSLFIYTITVSWLGFILATLFFVLFLFRTVESETWWRSTAKALLVTLGNYLVFVVWLGVKLPKGILPW